MSRASLSPVSSPEGKGDLEQKSFPLGEDFGEALEETRERLDKLADYFVKNLSCVLLT